MTTDPLDLLRASNPIPYGSSAPPIERVLAQIYGGPPARRRWRAWTGALVPALGGAAAIAVAVVALVLGAADHGSSVRHRSPAASSVPSAPRGGMRGLVFLQGMAFASASDGLISMQQCLGYRNGDPTSRASCRDWIATTTDMGASWRFTRRYEYVFNPRFSGSDGWAEGLNPQSDSGGGVARFFVTHDRGRSWSVAPTAAPALGPGQNVSVGGGEVWAVGSGCCTVTILHGSVTGSRLVATAAQPVAGSWTNVEVVAAGSRTAYVLNPDRARQTFVTHDDGRSWQRIESACPGTAFGRLASAGSAGSVWVSCQPWHGATTLRRAIDGGQGWQVLPGHFSNVFKLEPVSAQIAWGVTPGGAVVRTTDGGFTWGTVWSTAGSQPAALSSRPPKLVTAASATPMLSAQSASSASVVMIMTRGLVSGQARFTNLVVYRTTDGGATWSPSVVPLPER